MSLVGIELLTIDARIVIASVDTYVEFAGRRHSTSPSDGSENLPDLMGGGLQERGAKAVTKGAIEGVKESLGFGG